MPRITNRLLVPAGACLVAGLAVLTPIEAQATGRAPTLESRYQETSSRIISAALADSGAYARLTELGDKFGHRFSGSESLEDALDWIIEEMSSDGLENVRGEPVMVPHWVRGEESAFLIEPRPKPLPMLGLGGSIGTPPGGITAEVLVVESFDDLTTVRASEARGKIVLFDVPFTDYGTTVQYRSRGAIVAAQVGAVASLVRSVTPYSMLTPHTGGMSYSDDVPRIPHAAITTEDAGLLHRMQDRGERIVVRLEMNAETLPDAPSRNVIGEILGSEFPEEVIVVSGHSDTWDVGQGAMDDGGGIVAAWEAVRLLHELGLRPKRTIRAVMFVNEENGLRGGTAYRDAHIDELENHVLAIESDGGVFSPTALGFSGSAEAFDVLTGIAPLLSPLGVEITQGGGGADIGPIMREGVPGMGLEVDGTRYFWYHHTAADTIDKLDPRELSECVAALAVMVYVVADMDETLPRANGS
jgi:carboxypeptidase Q